jgi:hypothetical protein
MTILSPGGRAESLKQMIGGCAVWSNLIFFISALGWNENFISAARWNGIYSLKWICATKRWIYGRASRPITIQIPYKYRLVEPAEPVGLADACTPAPSSWNGNGPLKWNFHFSVQLKWNFHFSPAKLKWQFDKNIGRAARPLPLSFKGFRWASSNNPVMKLDSFFAHHFSTYFL